MGRAFDRHHRSRRRGTQYLPRGPDEDGRFGIFGGRFVAETLMPLILEVEKAYEAAKKNPGFEGGGGGGAELRGVFYLTHYVGRPSPSIFAERLTQHLGGARIYFKRDELNHTGAQQDQQLHRQILLAKQMGKTRIIAETERRPARRGGRHGVRAVRPALRRLHGRDRHRPAEAERVPDELLGAEVRPVTSGSRTLKDAMNEALRDWVTNVDDTFYIIGTAAGPHPYPAMVRDFQSR